jgi:hypothetical protein
MEIGKNYRKLGKSTPKSRTSLDYYVCPAIGLAKTQPNPERMEINKNQ